MGEYTGKLPTDLIFIDTETTGLDAGSDRLIEVGILRIKDGKEVYNFNQLLNPEVELPPEITQITGITAEDLKGKPTFAQVKDEIYQMLNGELFVAHNASFDYGFVENEFLRVDIPFSMANLCTVELSRALFPIYKRHNLDAISSRLNIKIKNRHRALDDALAIWEFFKHVLDNWDERELEHSLGRLIKPAKKVRLESAQAQVGMF